MIKTSIKIQGKPKKRKEILQTILSLLEPGFNHQGCLKTEVYHDVADKNSFYLFSDWATEKDLEKYKKSKSMAVLLGLQFLLEDSLRIDTYLDLDRRHTPKRAASCLMQIK